MIFTDKLESLIQRHCPRVFTNSSVRGPRNPLHNSSRARNRT